MDHDCVLKCGRVCDANDFISADRWGQLKSKSEKWKGLDRFGEIFDTTEWDNGPIGVYMHANCYLTLSSSRKLEQSGKRKEQDIAKYASEKSVESVESEGKETFSSASKRLRSSIGGPVHAKDKCIWCMKIADAKHPDRNTAQLLRISTMSGWRVFKRHTVHLKEDLLRTRLTKLVDSISDVFAADVRYHHSCWMKYITNNLVDSTTSMHLQNVTQSEMRNIFFRKVDSVIFGSHEIRTLQSLLEDYKQVSLEYGFSVGSMKTSYVKELLVEEYGESIGFHATSRRSSEFVYDRKAGGSYIDAALNSFGISDEQLISNLAPRLLKHIIENTSVTWCPTVEQLLGEENLSKLLMKLFSLMQKKKGHKELSEENSPALHMLSSLLTYFVTGERTISAINLTVVIHGMTRSRELVDMLHKCGICISYNDLLLLYTFWAVRDTESSKTCPRGIAYGKPAMVIVDNDDFKIDTLTGNAQGAHRSNVLYVQPETYEIDCKETTAVTSNTKKVLTRQLEEKCKELTDVRQYVCPQGASNEPPVRSAVTQPIAGIYAQRFRSVIHTLSRMNANGERPSVEDQNVPSYSGFQSCLLPSTVKSKPYYHVTYNEPPKKSVINDVMIKLVQAMEDNGMPFSFLVGDLPTYKLILELKTENSDRFVNITPVIGAFHQQMSYIYAIYKRFLGSGLSDLLISAGVIVEGSVDQALRGKHYRRGLRCIMLWREALIHERITMILNHKPLSAETICHLNILRKALLETKASLASAYAHLENKEDIQMLVDGVFEAPNTDMGTYWMSFIEMSDILLQNIHACHVRNFEEYLSSTRDMLAGMLAYNNHDYGKWLSDYWGMMTSLAEDKWQYLSQHFSQSLTGLPYSCQPMDLWIEVTMNLDSKLKQGWLQLLQNDLQLFCSTRNVNNVARIKTALKTSLDCHRKNQKHVECQPARMRKDELAVQDLLGCLEEFDANPFDDTAPDLRSLQSGLAASPDVVEDLAKALKEGETQANEILEKRVFSKECPLRASIPKNKRSTLATSHNIASVPQINALEMEKRALSILIDFAEKNDLIELGQVLVRRISDECLTMFNADGSMRKTAKSKLLQSFEKKPVIEKPHTYSSIVDMGLIWRLATPTSEDREVKRRSGSDFLWGDYLEKICCLVHSRHKDAEKLILINDDYNTSSIKDDEHSRRAEKYNNLPNVYPKEADKFPSASIFKRVMLKSENKVRLQKLLKMRFKATSNLHHAEIIYCEGNTAENMTNGESEHDFSFQQAEADTMIFSAYANLRRSVSHTVVIDSEDTDVYVQAAYVSNHIPGDLVIKSKSAFFNCKDLVSDSIASVLIPFHIITGCDHTSGFYGRGKKALLDRLKDDDEGQQLLHHVGDQLELSDEVRNNMRKFVITKIYGEKATSCSDARASRWRKMKKKSLGRLPPDEDTLDHHLERTNYLSFCQKHYDLQQHPSPINNGWEHINGKCRPVRYKVPAMPEFELYELGVATSDEDYETASEYGDISDDQSSDDE